MVLGAPQRNNLRCELERSLAFVPAGRSVFLRLVLLFFFKAIFEWQYLVDISVRCPNIDQILLPYQQEDKISPYRTYRYIGYGRYCLQTLCQPWRQAALALTMASGTSTPQLSA